MTNILSKESCSLVGNRDPVLAFNPQGVFSGSELLLKPVDVCHLHPVHQGQPLGAGSRGSAGDGRAAAAATHSVYAPQRPGRRALAATQKLRPRHNHNTSRTCACSVFTNRNILRKRTVCFML